MNRRPRSEPFSPLSKSTVPQRQERQARCRRGGECAISGFNDGHSVRASIRFVRACSMDEPSLAMSNSGHNATKPLPSRCPRCGVFLEYVAVS